MGINFIILGSIFEISGTFILALATIFDDAPRRIFREDKWWKRYWWEAWRPIYRNTETLKLKIKRTRKIPVYWIIPPKYSWNIDGFLCIFIGFLLQL